MKAKHHAQYVEMGGKERRDQLNIKFPEFAAKTKVRNEAVTSTLPVCSRRPGLAQARGCKRASTAAWCQSSVMRWLWYSKGAAMDGVTVTQSGTLDHT